MKRIIIDADPGIDDILALLLAFASPEVQLEAITTVSGNVGVDQTTHNALAFLAAVDKTDVAVARGSEWPLVREPVDAQYFHGRNGVGEVELPAPQHTVSAQNAVDVIIEQVLNAPGEITLVAVGPLTNLALALKREPKVAQATKEVIIMGGALQVAGNVTPAAEFNIFADPHAAHVVLHAGWPVKLVALDVTTRAKLRREHIQRLLQTGHPVARLIADMIEYSFVNHPREDVGFDMHDPLSVACAVRPDFVTWEHVYVGVELQGTHTLGETVGYFAQHSVPAPQPPNAQVSVDVDVDGFIEWYVERVERFLRVGR